MAGDETRGDSGWRTKDTYVGFDWEKAVGVPARGGGAGPDRMSLASADSGGGAGGSTGGGTGGGGDLRISRTPWTSASGVADELRTTTGTGLTDLKEANTGTAAGAGGFDCTSALREIQATWEARLTSVRDECGRLHGTLARTAKHFGEVDHHVADGADGVRVGDTPDWAR
jgi:hypothetical protein